ncbi:Plant UBX domain-containing protein 1 [Ranunculus cassubicifolius]
MRFEFASPSPCSTKRRKLMSSDPLHSDAAAAKGKLAAISEQLGREIRVFVTLTASPTSENVTKEEPDDFYEFSAEDYFRVTSTKKQDTVLKTRKIREAEEASRRSRINKATIRVRFPDNYTLEVKFQASETVQNLIDLLMKVIARPDLPFYLYTTPPKKQLKDMSQDFFSANFIPGAIVYFSYNLADEDEYAGVNSGPYLRDEIQSLNGLDTLSEPPQLLDSAPEHAVVRSPVKVQEPKIAEKKPGMPKWFKR